MSWKDDLQLSEDAIPHQNQLYHQLFELDGINRFRRIDNIILDRKYHIDVELVLHNGIKLLGQEKALRYEFARYNTFTIEFYQDRISKEQGEFFNLGAQFYLHGYWNSKYDGFEKWYFIKIFDFLTHLRQAPIAELERQTRPSTSRASFFYTNYNDIPREFIYSSSREGR
jgi:hypothetical protein